MLETKYPTSTRFDFLKTDEAMAFTRDPSLLRRRIEYFRETEKLVQPVILDEVQKVPGILDEVHWLIENEDISFILCGSSARKLKRDHANMLGGRAWRFELHPFSYSELPDFDLLTALNHGLIPSHYLEDGATIGRTLRAYVADYIKEEIMAEGLVRNAPGFSRFTDVLGFTTGEMVNYSNIAREAGVDAKTVKEYFSIITDTLLGTLVEPFAQRRRRAIITATPRFYLFDTGVAGYLARRNLVEPTGPEFGRAFEQFILMELTAYRSYSEHQFDIRYWRTNSGLEVDFVLGRGDIAIEVKGKRTITNKDTRGLRAFAEEQHFSPRLLVVCTAEQAEKTGAVTIFPWREFLDSLWSGKII